MLDKSTAAKLQKFAEVFKTAKERDANESDTVMYLVQFFKEVLGYDPLTGEISKELPIKDRFCDFGIKLDNQIIFLVEAKRVGGPKSKDLSEKHVEQAANYGSRAKPPINWVLLTNGVMWQLYHLTFSDGIENELVFKLDFLQELEKNPDSVWDTLSMLAKSNVREGSLDTYYEQQKLLCPKMIISTLLSWDIEARIRQELNREAPARLEMKAVHAALLNVLDKALIAEAGDIKVPNKKKHYRKRTATTKNQSEQPEAEAIETPTDTQPQAAEEKQAEPPATTSATK